MLFASRAVLAQSEDEQKLVDLTNQARTEKGLKRVVWDANLAAAAHAHAVMMSENKELSHQYDGEPDVAKRTASAGAHFSEVAENIAAGTSPGQIHGAWMQSQVHHDNLMNANVDHIGVALVRAHGTLYAVADFSQSVSSLDPPQVEEKVGAAIKAKGLTLITEGEALEGARKYCALEDGVSGAGLNLKAGFLMRWQNSDISQIPQQLEQALSSGKFKQAAVGACAPKGASSSGPVFSGYRIAVLLY